MTKHVPIFAHRGASGHAIENSFDAFNKARRLGADGIEIDLQRSSDNELFVFHDVHLNRLVGVKRFIYDCTAEELMQYRLGKRFFRVFPHQQIPMFKEYLKWTTKHQIPVNIELKESLLNDYSALEKILPTLKLPDGSHFSSFHEELLKVVKSIRPDFETALIVTKKLNWHELHELKDVDVIHANKKYYKRRYLKACEDARMPIRFYGIDGTESFIEKPHPNVIGWITDYPDRVAKKQKR